MPTHQLRSERNVAPRRTIAHRCRLLVFISGHCATMLRISRVYKLSPVVFSTHLVAGPRSAASVTLLTKTGLPSIPSSRLLSTLSGGRLGTRHANDDCKPQLTELLEKKTTHSECPSQGASGPETYSIPRTSASRLPASLAFVACQWP